MRILLLRKFDVQKLESLGQNYEYRVPHMHGRPVTMETEGAN